MPQMTLPQHDRATLDRMLHHVYYEMHMLAVSRLVGLHVTPETAAPFASNLIVEIRALHARNVAEFLLGSNKLPNSLAAAHYLPTFSINPTDAAEIEKVRKRANKEIAHITTERISDDEHKSGAQSKAWKPESFVPLFEAAVTFLDGLLKANWLDATRRPDFEELHKMCGAAVIACRAQATPAGSP
jgi:hypothetical protein